MPVRFLSDAELARLSSWPDEIAAEDLDSALHAPIPLSPSQVDSAQRGAPGSNDVDAQHLGDALAPDDGASHSLWPSPSDYLIPERRNNRGPTTGRSLPGYHTAAVCSGLSPLSIPERSSCESVWPCEEMACSTAALSTSSRSPAIVSVQLFSLGCSRQSTT